MPPLTPLPADLAATFAQRVAERDVVAPPDQSPAAIAARLDHWLQTTHHQRDLRARQALVPMLLLLLAQPTATPAALTAAAHLSPRMTARHLLKLQAWHLTEWTAQGQLRHYRLTRAGEDALLPLVTGAAG